jgi:hypothetical protein
MSDAPSGDKRVSIAAARGEYESFQVIVSGASDGLGNVNMTVSDLEGPSGQVIPRNSFTLYRE